MGDPNRFGPCHYAFCTTKVTQALKVCMVLNNRCTGCLNRGHQRDGRCGQVRANLEIFENSANHGYVTSNRYQDWGASNGFYPIVRWRNCTTLPLMVGMRDSCPSTNMTGGSSWGCRQPAQSLGRRGVVGNAGDRGKRLKTSTSTQGPQCGAN
jgi:hypothetical protein